MEMCTYCGIRPVRPAKLKSPNGPGGRTKYCSVCKPIVKRELNMLYSHRWHERKRLDFVIDPISGEPIRGQTAVLCHVGLDYLALKQATKAIKEPKSQMDISKPPNNGDMKLMSLPMEEE